jgi:hypothetical protein
MESQRRPYSRFQVLTSGQRAWARDHKRVRFYFDGFRFWRQTSDGGYKVMTSWQSPRFGWVHSPSCTCGLCAAAPLTDDRRDEHRAA